MTEHPQSPDAPDAEPSLAATRPRVLGRLAVCVVAVIVALGIAEAVLQLSGIELRAERLLRDPVLGWRNRPGWQGQVFSINSLGFLGAEFAPAKPEGAVRVFCLGDSCTAGDLLPDYDNTYPRQLERLLHQRWPDRQIEVINAGVGGYSSLQGRLWLERQILGYQADLLVVYFGWNDHWPARLGGEDKVVAGSWSERARAWVSWCKLLQLAAKAYHNVRGHPVLPKGGGGSEVTTARSTRGPRVSVADYRANLLAMANAMRERGGEAVLITAPNYLALGDAASRAETEKALVALHAEYNDAVRQVAKDGGVALVDAAQEFACVADPKGLFWRAPSDFIHLSAEGYRRLARSVADCPVVKRIVEGH